MFYLLVKSQETFHWLIKTTACYTDNSMEIGLGRGTIGAGWRWRKGEKAGMTVMA